MLRTRGPVASGEEVQAIAAVRNVAAADIPLP